MTTDLDHDLYVDWSDAPLAQWEHEQEAEGGKSQEHHLLMAPSIKMVQEGIFEVWRKFVRKNIEHLYEELQAMDYSREVKFELKNPQYEASRVLRQSMFQMCYIGYCQIDKFINYVHGKGLQIATTREFSDFLHVMGAYRSEAVNYLQMIRSTYTKKGVLMELSYFESVRFVMRYEKGKESDVKRAVELVQVQYRQYMSRKGEAKIKRQGISNLSAQDLFRLLTRKISSSNMPMKEIFEIFDKDKDGNISFEEFESAFVKSKILVAPEILQSVFNYFDVNHNNSIQYMEFLSKVVVEDQPSTISLFTIQLKVDQILFAVRELVQKEYESFEQCFNAVKAYDRLKLSVEDFSDFIANLSSRFSQIQLENLFHYLDKDNKGYLNIQEFSRIYVVGNEDQEEQEVEQEQGESRDDSKNKKQKMREEIDDAKFLYHYIQAENMQSYIEHNNQNLLGLIGGGQQEQKKVRFQNKDKEDESIVMYRSQLLRLEVFLQQLSLKTISQIRTQGLSIRQLFGQFSVKFADKFLELKEFAIFVNWGMQQSVDEGLIVSIYKLFSNAYTHRMSVRRFVEMLELGSQVSSVQLRVKLNHKVDRLRPVILEQFQQCGVLNEDSGLITLKQCFECLGQMGIKLEMFEVQKLADDGIIRMQQRRYMVHYERLLDEMFPTSYKVEQVILSKYGLIVIKAWRRMKTRFLAVLFNYTYI